MKISELQKELEKFKQQHGDLDCVVHDGLDPSDPSAVRRIELCENYAWMDWDWVLRTDKAAFIKC